MTTYFEYPILIVGAGPTGLLLANLLGKAGLEVLIVDKNSGPSSFPKAILLDDEGFRSLQAIGVSEVVASKSLMGYGARYYNEEGECFAKISPGKMVYGYPKRNSFFQPELEKALEENLKKYPSVKLLRDTSFEVFSQNDYEVHSILCHDNEKIEIKSHLLVGADGGRSTVRSLLGISLEGFGYDSEWGVIDTKNDPDQEDFTRFYCDYKRPFVSIPAPGGGRRYEFKLLEGETEKSVLEPQALGEIVKSFRSVLKQEDIVRASVYRFSACVANRFQKGRVLLAGDSCHMTPPFAGQGMNTGLRDAHNLSWKIERYLRGSSPFTLLASYEQERKKKVEDMVSFAVTLGEIVMPRTELDSKVMSTVWKMAKLIPGAKEYIEEMKFKPNPHYHEGAFLFPNHQSSCQSVSVGKMIPQPMVKDFFGKEERLDELLGDGFALLGFGIESLSLVKRFQSRSFPKLSKIIFLKELDDFQEDFLDGIALVSMEEGLVNLSSYSLLNRNKFLYLIRPDRYIFLESSLENFEAQVERISSLL